MRQRAAVLAFGIASTLVLDLAAEPSETACRLESPLRQAVTSSFPGYSVLTLERLDAYGRGLFRKDHGRACPGVTQVNIFGDKVPATALSLVNGNKALLVVARQRVAKTWSLEKFEETDGTPVVWKEPAGEYTDVYGEKTLTVVKEGLVWCGYRSWAILYAWVDGRVQKIWLAD